MIGKKIMAGEPLFNFETGECVGWTRRRNIGIIKYIDDKDVKIFLKSNPEGYKNYTLDRGDFDKWVKKKLYILR